MPTSDQSLSFLLAAALHLLGLLWMGNVPRRAPHPDEVAPSLEPSSVELTLPSIEDERDAAGPPAVSAANASPPADASVPELRLPQPDEAPPPPSLPEKPAFTAAFAQLPEPTPTPPAPAPVPAPVQSVPAVAPAAPSAAPKQTAASEEAAATLLSPEGNLGKVDAHPSLDRPIKPSYPIGARRRGEEGSVILDVSVGPDGRARAVSLVASSGFADLDQAAARAAAQGRFKPATRASRPIEALARITIIFRLRDQ